VPDEPLTLKVVDMPLTGVAPSFVARIAVDCGETRIGAWPVVVQTKIWHDVLVAGATLSRGQPLAGADVRVERRDLLLTRDCVTPETVANGSYEFVTSVSTGQLITGRALRVRPAITRGTIVDGLVADGAMTISLKVEVLEDGVVGQNLRVRNLKTRREMLGKVQNEQTIVLYL
jgi:flagellar basal body P-ring formation protein FlgA